MLLPLLESFQSHPSSSLRLVTRATNTLPPPQLSSSLLVHRPYMLSLSYIRINPCSLSIVLNSEVLPVEIFF